MNPPQVEILRSKVSTSQELHSAFDCVRLRSKSYSSYKPKIDFLFLRRHLICLSRGQKPVRAACWLCKITLSVIMMSCVCRLRIVLIFIEGFRSLFALVILPWTISPFSASSTLPSLVFDVLGSIPPRWPHPLCVRWVIHTHTWPTFVTLVKVFTIHYKTCGMPFSQPCLEVLSY